MLTTEQLQVRRSGVGASEVAAVLGMSPWRTRVDVWCDKVGIGENRENDAMRAGNRLEDAVADWYADEYKVLLQRCNETLRHPKFPWALATPDRFVLTAGRRRKRVCEIKTVGHFGDDWGPEGSDEFPVYYLIQVQWQLAVTGMDEAVLVAFFLDQRKLRVYTVKRNDDLISSMLEEVGEFWETFVVPRVRPPIDDSDGTRRWLKHTFPREENEEIVSAPAAAAKLAFEYLAALDEEGEVKRRKEEAGSMLKAMIGMNAGMRGPWGTATWKTQRSRGVDWEAAAKSLAAQLRATIGRMSAASGIDASDELKALTDEAVADRYQKSGSRVLSVTTKTK